MASNPPPFQVEDNTDEDFFDKLVNDDDDVGYRITSSSVAEGLILNDGNEFDEAKAFANLSINELGSNAEVNFENDTSANHNGWDDLSGKGSVVEPGNEVKTLESENSLVSFKSFSFDNLIPNMANENESAEVLPDVTPASKNSGPESSDVSMVGRSTGVSGAPGVKEVDWSAFSADAAQNNRRGFGSYSDFFNDFGGDNTDDAFDKTVGDGSKVSQNVHIENNVHSSTNADNFDNSGQCNEGYYNGVLSDPIPNADDLSSSQYWENQYPGPGWKCDPSTGQWYQVDECHAGTFVQENTNSNLSGWELADGQTEFSYMQQNPQIITAVAEAGSTGSVTSWNQASQVSDATGSPTNWNQTSQISNNSNGAPSDWNQGFYSNNSYPPHMVFDPQYPGWYYDTIRQEWLTLESYPASTQSTTRYQDQKVEDPYASTNTFSQNNGDNAYSSHSQGNSYSSQGYVGQVTEGNWAGSVGSYSQHGARMWVPETVGKEGTSPNIRDQVLENSYGKNISENTLGSQLNTGRHGVSATYNENLRQSQSFPLPSQYGGAGGNASRHFNDSQINQNNQNHFSNDYQMNRNSVNFSGQQFQNVQVPYAPASERSSAGRPAHALVAFGFGGKLIVMKPNYSPGNLNFRSQDHVGGPISVLNLAEVVYANCDTSSHGMGVNSYFQALCQQPIPGPLTGGGSATKELNKWIDERITNVESPDRLLLSLLKIACQHYGKLRSPYGTDASLKESDAPESAVARLFASAKKNGSQFNQYAAVAQCLQQLPSEGQMQVTAAAVQNLLVSGRKREALQCAQEGQLWGPAIVLAALLGDQFYVETIRQMAIHQLVAGSPLRTLCLLIAGCPADVFSGDSTSTGTITGTVNMHEEPLQFAVKAMLDDWEENLAVITANRTKGDDLVLINLGDCLWKQRSEIIPAHICYLVAEQSFEPFSDSARLCLVGADHFKSPRTYASPEAIQGHDSVIYYDFGLLNWCYPAIFDNCAHQQRTEIYEYSKTLGNSQFMLLPFQPYKFVYALMLAEVGRISDALKYCQAVFKSLKIGRSPEVENLRNLVSSLEERIKGHQQGGFSTNLAPKEIFGKLLNLFDSTAQRVVGGLPPSVPSAVGTLHGNDNNYQATGPRVSASQSTMAMSSLVPSQSMEPISEWAADSNKMARHTRSVSEPDFGRSPMKGETDSLKEASSTGVQDKASASGATSRFGRFNFGSQLLQKTVGLVLKPRQGRQAKLGESNKFYYDEKLKRWVEEGAEAPAAETALPPPPTTATFQNGKSDFNLQSPLPSDASHGKGSPEYRSPNTLDNTLRMPPLPPTTNQYSSRGRMGVRSRYVDTFNQGVGNTTSSFQSPSAPSIKPATGFNPNFFVPASVPHAEQPFDTSVNSSQSVSSIPENLSTSPLNDSSQATTSPSSATMQRIGSMNSIPNKRMSGDGSFNVHSRRTASWSGSFNGPFSPPHKAELKPLGEVLGMHPSTFMSSDPSLVSSSMNDGSFSDDLQEVEL